MIIDSKHIRDVIKDKLDSGFIFKTKLHQTDSIYDKTYYCRDNKKQLKEDILDAVYKIEDLFDVNRGAVKNLYTLRDIFDCDNFAFSLKSMMSMRHYGRYLDGIHEEGGEYAVFTAIAEMPSLLGGQFVHAFNMFIISGQVYFYDMTNDKFWSIDEDKPKIIKIG